MKPPFTVADAPQIIPVFPLPGALLLPRGRLPLNIFEPRYLAMIDDTLKTDHRLIGMIQPRGPSKDGAPSALYNIGCAGRLSTLSETDDGRYLVALNGICRFRVSSEVEGFTPYRRVHADWSDFALDTKQPVQDDPDFAKDAFLSLVGRYFRVKSLDTDWDALKQADEETIVHALCMICPFSAEEKQALLEAEGLSERRKALTTLLEIESAREDGPGGLQ